MSVCASKSLSPSAPEKQATSGNDFRLALQPATVKPSAFSLAAASLPMTPNPKHADLDVAGLGLLVVVFPDTLALLAFVAAQLAQMDERMHDDPFAHPVGEIGIDHPHDRLIGQSGIGEEMIDAGAERDNHPKVGKILERARGMAPTERIADRGAIERLIKRHDLLRGQQRFQARSPGLRVPSGNGDEHAHCGVPTMRSITGSPDEIGASSS